MVEKRRVMIIVGSLDFIGGIAEMLVIIAKCHPSEDYELAFCSFTSDEGPPLRQILKLGRPVFRLGTTRRIYDPRIIWKLVALLRSYRPDIVHTVQKANIPGRIAARIAGVPIILCHEMYIDALLSEKIAEVFNRRLDRFTDRIISVSNAVQDARVKGKGGGKYMVIHPLIDLERIPPPDRLPPARRFKNGSFPVIGTLGRIHPEKGQQYLIQAMPLMLASFPDLKLVIIGKGPQEEKLKGLVESLDLSGHVEFTGYVTDTRPILSAFDLFVFPSMMEGCPLAVLEAMATELPVVASAVGGIPEEVEDGRTGLLVPPRDPEAIADAVVDLLSDIEKAREMGRRGRQRVCEYFSPGRYARDLAAVYEELLNLKGLHRSSERRSQP